MKSNVVASLAALGAISLSFGCNVDPFCLTCEDAGFDANVPDGGGDGSAGDGAMDAALDGPLGEACLVAEVCNGLDDDCDGMVDEDFDLSSDLAHCGGCDVLCAPLHAFGSCEAGECHVASCDVGYHDLNDDPLDGCEYRCLATAMDESMCDLRDNDCDGEVDEDAGLDTDPLNCGSCGRICALPHGSAGCVMGDCVIDACDIGYHDRDGSYANGCEYACTAAIPPDEVCNARDDDCDGMVDEGDPGGGASCGGGLGECVAGVESCVGGAVICSGAVGPTDELCNGRDDDCDGTADEDDPEGGRFCGTSLGACSRGTGTCMGGALVCVGGVGPEPELCDGLDNDCDGMIDQGNPESGASCGIDVGACAFGTMNCRGGVLVCEGGTGPALESCNRLDDDCDGSVDEDFDLTTDLRHCGMCGNACSYPGGIAGCAMSTCFLSTCRSGFHDLNGDPSDGCEFACSFLGSEVCNGRDDDCDGFVDEGLSPPASFCNSNGVCAGTIPSCSGLMGWVCTYPVTREPVETLCDGIDNDCDGLVDEPFPTVGTVCGNGAGLCQRTGTFVCNGTLDGVLCTALPAGLPTDEVCDNLDNDCDGSVDEREPDDVGTPWRDGIDVTAISTVVVDRAGGGTMRIMQYEASRPDATATAGGAASTIACSRADVVPWTTVTWTQARNACCALNVGGACPAMGAPGWRLCDAADWQSACRGPAGACNWSYQSTCGASQPALCNGDEHDCDAATPGDQDCLYNTGSPTFPTCNTDWGAAGAVYDLSGNAKEWTNTAVSPSVYSIRGGAYVNLEPGRACDFDFAAAAPGFSHPDTGFRCCLY